MAIKITKETMAKIADFINSNKDWILERCEDFYDIEEDMQLSFWLDWERNAEISLEITAVEKNDGLLQCKGVIRRVMISQLCDQDSIDELNESYKIELS